MTQPRYNDESELPPESQRDEKHKELAKHINYSERYRDGTYEYRHVAVPKEMLAFVPRSMMGQLLTEKQWRSIGICQSTGWEHYEVHHPEPHIFLFRRPL